MKTAELLVDLEKREYVPVYKKNSYPPKILEFEDVEVLPNQELVYTLYGDCFRKVEQVAGSIVFEEVHTSVLNEGITIEDLDNYNQYKLFWTLSKNEFEKSK